MGFSDDGDDPAPLAQTGSPCAGVHRSDQDIVALGVPGGTGIEAQFDLVGVRASHLAGPRKLREEYQGLRCQELAVSLRGLRGRIVPDDGHETCCYSARTT